MKAKWSKSQLIIWKYIIELLYLQQDSIRSNIKIWSAKALANLPKRSDHTLLSAFISNKGNKGFISNKVIRDLPWQCMPGKGPWTWTKTFPHSLSLTPALLRLLVVSRAQSAYRLDTHLQSLSAQCWGRFHLGPGSPFTRSPRAQVVFCFLQWYSRADPWKKHGPRAEPEPVLEKIFLLKF